MKALTKETAYYAGLNFESISRIRNTFYNRRHILNIESEFIDEMQILVSECFYNPNDNLFEVIDDVVSKIVGKENCYRVGSGSGMGMFHVSFLFRKDCFYEMMNKLKDFCDFFNISDIVKFFDATDPDEDKHTFVFFSDYIKV